MSIKLDILGQQDSIRIYTQLTFCYSCEKGEIDVEFLSKTLRIGLDRLHKRLPYIGGEIIGKLNESRIELLDKPPLLVVKDLRKETNALLKTFKQLEELGFPSHLLDETVLCPKMTIPGSRNEDEEKYKHDLVFLCQLSIIEGGILFTVLGEHAVMDMTGLSLINNLLSKTCKGEELSQEELNDAQINRTLIPYNTNDFEPINKEAKEMYLIENRIPFIPQPGAWVSLNFSKDKLKELKLEVMKTIPGNSFVSTDDCLCALIWKYIIKSRLYRLKENESHKLCRAVDSRKYIGASVNQMGLFVNMTFNRMPIKDVINIPLGGLAYKLRETLSNSNIKESLKQLATGIYRNEPYSISGELDITKDIQISSWSKMNKNSQLDFGFNLGCPKSVKRPSFVPFEGLVYFMPKLADGSICIMVSLRDEDLEHFRNNLELNPYCDLVF